MRAMITSKRANELFNYDPDTGVLTSKVDRGGYKVGDVIKPGLKEGRVWGFTVDGKSVSAIRLIRALRGDDVPKSDEFHFVDGDRMNLRSSNVARRVRCGALTSDIARQYFYIDGSTLRWKRTVCSMATKGDQAGTTHASGSMYVMFSGKFYNCAHVAYLVAYGDVPAGHKVRHVRRDASDNHPDNLRVVRIGGPTEDDEL